MEGYITLLACMIGLPLLYWGIMQWYKADFEEEKNQKRKILTSLQEFVAIILSEAALIRIWFSMGKVSFANMIFELLYIMLVAMTVLCMTDLWEKIVPNKILLLLLPVFIIVLGIQGVCDINALIAEIPGIILGLLFCSMTFGLGYLLSRGSMGAGDVKLSLLMGLYMTGEYVVGAIVYGCLASAVYSVIQLLRKKLGRKDEIPFVPFLYLGLIIRYFVG